MGMPARASPLHVPIGGMTRDMMRSMTRDMVRGMARGTRGRVAPIVASRGVTIMSPAVVALTAEMEPEGANADILRLGRPEDGKGDGGD